MSFRLCSPTSRHDAPTGSGAASSANAGDATTWPPCAVAATRAASCTTSPNNRAGDHSHIAHVQTDPDPQPGPRGPLVPFQAKLHPLGGRNSCRRRLQRDKEGITFVALLLASGRLERRPHDRAVLGQGRCVLRS
jgi:hypothetical protein